MLQSYLPNCQVECAKRLLFRRLWPSWLEKAQNHRPKSLSCYSKALFDRRLLQTAKM